MGRGGEGGVWVGEGANVFQVVERRKPWVGWGLMGFRIGGKAWRVAADDEDCAVAEGGREEGKGRRERGK